MQVITSPSLVPSSYILFLSYLPLSLPLPLALSCSVLPPCISGYSIHPTSFVSFFSPPIFSFDCSLLHLYSPHPPYITHCQAENILSEIQKLRELIDQSESVIFINLDSQRNCCHFWTDRHGLWNEPAVFTRGGMCAFNLYPNYTHPHRFPECIYHC